MKFNLILSAENYSYCRFSLHFNFRCNKFKHWNIIISALKISFYFECYNYSVLSFHSDSIFEIKMYKNLQKFNDNF